MVKEALSGMGRPDRPVRSILLLPAACGWHVGMGAADAFVLGVPGAGTATIGEKVAFLRATAPGRPVFVQLGPGAGGIEDLDAAVAADADGIVPADARSGLDLQRLGARLAVREAECGVAEGRTRILALPAAGAAGLLGLSAIPGSSARLAGLGWDATALAAELGVRAESRALPAPLALARVLTVVAARAAGVPAIDTATVLQGEPFLTACLRARRDGFAGKFARDAAQVAAINAAFG